MTDIPSDPDRVADRLLVLLDEQTALFGELDALSQRQGELIDSDDGERLLDLLAERQRVVDKIDASARGLEPVRVAWDRVATSASPTDRDQVRRKLASLSALVSGVTERDQADRVRLERRRDQIAGEIADLDRGKRALGAYRKPAQGPRFQDREG